VKTILVVFGTRPETIKLAPLILRAKKDSHFNVLVCSTGQHREMIKPLFNFFGIKPDFDLDLMKPGQSLTDISVGIMRELSAIFETHTIDGLVVQGDTASCFIASLVAFYHRIEVFHIEAGLRSGDLFSPYPEEFNRKGTGLIAKLHFAPTEAAKANLVHEHYPASDIFVTGNTGIDALFEAQRKIQESPELKLQFDKTYSFLNPQKKLILVTVHRRESFGAPIEEIMKGLVALAQREDVEILLPLHMNPQVRKSAEQIFNGHSCWIDQTTPPKKDQTRIWLCEPIDYVPFIYLMDRAHLILTDSGGIQEEAPSLGKPVLVAREKTERPEAIAAGTSKLIPLEARAFLSTVEELLDTPALYDQMAKAQNPFGDGRACERILNILAERF
jgi:UDP-N-acetylglucosamine 2-epimerase (non-hydrolysing)